MRDNVEHCKGYVLLLLLNAFMQAYILEAPKVIRQGPEGQNLHLAGLHDLDDVGEEDVSVALAEAVDVVRHLAGVVVDDEAFLVLLVVLVAAHHRVQVLAEG